MKKHFLEIPLKLNAIRQTMEFRLCIILTQEMEHIICAFNLNVVQWHKFEFYYCSVGSGIAKSL